MSLITSLRATASALTAQRLRMDVIANNIANAETTKTADGGPYKKESVVFAPRASAPQLSLPAFVQSARDLWQGINAENSGVQVTQIVESSDPGSRVYDPKHPDADAQGYVSYPNVNLVTEMTDLLAATRSYEANITVLNAAKQMAVKTLEIGKG
ncbi:MAG: flagellar basal body rod protein FlgC [Chloroflexi bacterium]|nr:flagellar basal body rod protein FlgC [Chloroflexota bacterium]